MFSPSSLASTGWEERWPSWDPSGSVLPYTTLHRCRRRLWACQLRGCSNRARPQRSRQCPHRRQSCPTPRLMPRRTPCRQPPVSPDASSTASRRGKSGVVGRCLLPYARVRHDRPASIELLLRLLVLLKKLEVGKLRTGHLAMQKLAS